jgi:hypothetical protein
MPPRPVYWKPRYATRSMQHRAWAKRDAAREQAAAAARGPSLLTRLRAWLAARRR